MHIPSSQVNSEFLQAVSERVAEVGQSGWSLVRVHGWGPSSKEVLGALEEATRTDLAPLLASHCSEVMLYLVGIIAQSSGS